MTKPREISVEEAMAIAIDFLKDGRIRDADAICRRVLEASPGHADALHYAGMIAHRDGRSDEAVALIRESLERAPNQADWHSNLGVVLQARDDLEGAMDAFRRAIALEPRHGNAHNNLGVLLRVFGRYEEAERHYVMAIAINPNHADAYHNLAILYDLMGRAEDAVTAYSTEVALRPGNPGARRHLAMAYCTIGQPEKAVQVCEEWIRLEPDNPQARHALAACSGRDVPARASDAYVQKVFDQFAEGFEAKLARLHYRAPELVAAALAAAGVSPDGRLDVLDAGCGTGLCGPLLAPYARRLVGVDLSAGMLQHARDKGVYHALVQAELTRHLSGLRGVFDIIVSADTLVYFGALDAVVGAAAVALRPGGLFIFTVEEALDAPAGGGEAVAHAVDPQSSAPYRIRPHGRYNHRADYVERLLADAGLHASIERAELRKESGLPVAGLVVRAARPAAVTDADARGAHRARLTGEHHA
jgi:predicted TPR repeat methyltransferase